eukprot:gene2006-3900_t
MPVTSPDYLVDILKDTARPCFVFGTTPPREGTTEEMAIKSCEKFIARSAALATDGFIVYDIQDEKGRTNIERPFPFRKTLNSSWYASLIPKFSGKQCVVYKCVVEESIESFDEWLDEACGKYRLSAFNLVGAASSNTQYKGPNMQQAAARTQIRKDCSFGCVCIPERHMTKGGEPYNMLQKSSWGAEWFITQGVYAVEPVIKLINEYGDICKKEGVCPKKIIITFAPCGREKTMTFIKWLGILVPPNIEQQILTASNPVQESIQILGDFLSTILTHTGGSGVPLGINVESLSIYKEEIDAAHTLFQKLQATMLNHRGSPWSVQWFCVRQSREISEKVMNDYDAALLLAQRTPKALGHKSTPLALPPSSNNISIITSSTITATIPDISAPIENQIESTKQSSSNNNNGSSNASISSTQKPKINELNKLVIYTTIAVLLGILIGRSSK